MYHAIELPCLQRSGRNPTPKSAAMVMLAPLALPWAVLVRATPPRRQDLESRQAKWANTFRSGRTKKPDSARSVISQYPDDTTFHRSISSTSCQHRIARLCCSLLAWTTRVRYPNLRRTLTPALPTTTCNYCGYSLWSVQWILQHSASYQNNVVLPPFNIYCNISRTKLNFNFF
jgi:hypothetical protein